MLEQGGYTQGHGCFIGQVFMPSSGWSGQKPTRPVSSGTTPIQPQGPHGAGGRQADEHHTRGDANNAVDAADIEFHGLFFTR